MKHFAAAATAGLLIAGSGFLAIRAQEAADATRRHRGSFGEEQSITQQDELPVADPTCTFFGPEHDKFVEALRPSRHNSSRLTEDVVAMLGTSKSDAVASLPSAPGGSRTDAMQNPVGIIDKYIFQQLSDSKVAPAPPTTDQEFLRRVTLDLTGRIPTPAAVISFLNDTSTDKRTKLVDSLIGSPEWVDKWTVFFADLYKNNSTNDLGANRFAQGVSAFNSYIRTSLQNGTPYNKMVGPMISGIGTDSWSQGELNFLVGGVMGGGPIQDVFDQQTAIVAEKFLGMAHVNCILCHNGRGHLDAISLWGYYKTRNDAWGMASFLSRLNTARVPAPGSTNGQPYYWSLQNTRAVDYQLNTQTGNRPARGLTNSKQTVPPAYITNGATPPANSNYRQFLADQLTGDFQFARASVNYMWEYFFGIGLVTPSNQFDLMRLDPDNPPKDCPLDVSPCTLQASHPRLLNELAQSFINSGYNVKALMKQMVNSRAYQLSSRYEGTWNSANERLFGRKLVRRLWSEEVADAVTQTSGIGQTYTGANWNPPSVTWAMQLPEPLNTGNAALNVLNAFLRGNRDDEVRRGDSTIPQALALMNDTFVTSRVITTNAASLVVKMAATPAGQEDQAVTTMYLTVLSRYPSSQELSTAVANIKSATNATNKTQEYRNLLWSLYNKVDFMFNY